MPYIWDGNMGPDDPATEDSVTRCFAEREAGQLRYCGEHRCWYVFDGAVWRRDRTGQVVQRARVLARDLGTFAGRHFSGLGLHRKREASTTRSMTA